MTEPGRCACRCECTSPAVLAVRPKRPWWKPQQKRVNVCWPCGEHAVDQVEKTGKVWKP